MNGSGHSHGSGHNAGRSQQHHGQHNTQAYQQQRMSMHNVAPQAAAQVPIDMNYPTYAYGHPHAHYSYDPSAMNMNVRNPADVHSYGYYIPAVSAVPTADVSQLSAHNVYGQLNDQEWAEHVFSSMKAQAQAQAQAQYMGGLNLGVGVGGLVTPPHGGYAQRQSIPSKRSDGTQNGQDGSTAVADAQSGGAVSVAPKIDERSMDPNQQQSMYYATQMGVSGYVPYGSNAQDPQAQAQLMNNINVNHGHGMHSTFMPPLQNYYAAFPASLGLGSVFPASYIDQQNQTFGAVYPAASAPTAVPITVPVQPSVVPVTTAAQAPATSTVPASSPAAATPAAAPSASVTPETKLSQTTQNQSPPVETKVSSVIESFADLTLAATPALSASSAAVTDVPPVEALAPQPEAQARKPFSYADALANPARKILPVVPKPAAPAPPAPAPTTVRSGGSPRSVSASGSSNVRPQTSSTSSSQRPSTSTNPATRRADLPGTNPGPNAFNSSPSKARCFVIKSYSADDIHKSIKYGVWASTEHGNRRLDGAFRESAGTVPVYLFFSVNGSGCFCGMAQMMSAVDYSKAFGAWAQSEKWPGQFKVKWIFIKNLPNREVRHITLPNNSNKPVTNSRDTQEIPLEQALQLLKVYHSFRHKNSILDDFDYFDQEEEKRKQQPAAVSESDSGKDGPATDSSAVPSTPTPPSAGTAQPGRAPAKA